MKIREEVQALEVQFWFALLDENVLDCFVIFISRTIEKKRNMLKHHSTKIR